MIQCPYCDRTFSSNGSYRVHKHRFHRGLEYKRPIVGQEKARQPLQEPIENELRQVDHEETADLPEEQPKLQEPEHHDSSVVEIDADDVDSVAIMSVIGTIATVLIILALLGKKQ